LISLFSVYTCSTNQRCRGRAPRLPVEKCRQYDLESSRCQQLLLAHNGHRAIVRTGLLQCDHSSTAASKDEIPMPPPYEKGKRSSITAFRFMAHTPVFKLQQRRLFVDVDSHATQFVPVLCERLLDYDIPIQIPVIIAWRAHLFCSRAIAHRPTHTNDENCPILFDASSRPWISRSGNSS
jgi:hypothetical protein